MDKHTLKCPHGQAQEVYEDSVKSGKQKRVRTLTVETVESFAQTLRVTGRSKETIEGDTS
jgi:hypothetical protein